MWQHYLTEEKDDAFIDPNIVRAVLPSRFGATFALLVLDGGAKVHVSQGSPAQMRESLLAPAALLAGHVPQLASTTVEYVRSFAAMMEDRLSRNRHKGDREGWLNESFMTHLEHAKKHLKDLETAFLHGAKQEDIDRLTADCANRLMMARDKHAQPK
jgi:hypothetical protein